MKYKIAIGGIMGVPVTFLDKYSNKMGGTRSSDSQVHQSTLNCLNAVRLSTEEMCIVESSFAEKFKNCIVQKSYIKILHKKYPRENAIITLYFRTYFVSIEKYSIYTYYIH